MSQRPSTPQRERPTEYRLSLSSNPSSRRPSLGATARDQHVPNQTMIDKYVLPQLHELSDSMVTLDGNMTHMNFIHESITDLNESLSALLYGLMCNSWCVDFPKISHDTPHELRLIEKLDELKQEREALMAKLKPTQATELSGAPFSRQMSSIVPHTLYRNENIQESKEIPINTVENNDDEDNTAASFVSNPTTFKPQSISSFRNSDDLAGNPSTISTSSKLRRRSILHQIRSNAATGSTSTTSTRITPEERKKSLAVSAKRILIQARSSATAVPISGPASTNNNKATNTNSTQPNRTARPRQRTYNSKTLTNRPPFR
ncbi:unnamed protein product [Kluyveromyces dobzhanskii CBS 2104]|uniref:DASH complex subunit DAM1 n=1 Tax=Kluyveromyces dobzhanskii CBS 2104 TaxID=1427455 RepID=A0A0A8L2Q2_9SACH|nr:unnamed protein product [Kluyveromyces dobzhanskii CBS 2104]